MCRGENYIYMPIYGKPNQEFELLIKFSKIGKYSFYPKPTIEEICNPSGSLANNK